MEWIHSNSTGTGSFTVSNTKLEDLFAVKHVAYIFIKLHSHMFIQLWQISMLTVQISIYSFIVTSNKNIHTYSSMCIVGVHSDMHSSSAPVLFRLSKNHVVFICLRQVARY